MHKCIRYGLMVLCFCAPGTSLLAAELAGENNAGVAASEGSPLTESSGDIDLVGWVYQQVGTKPKGRQVPWLKAMQGCVEARDKLYPGKALSSADLDELSGCADRGL
ncbi:hypothetical protein [Pseudomonas aeruginosa]|uniref:hypothetical protein n=1 Tax=Pseudomonas aeruginosa TaxID=287 RepID=UPI000BB59C65|nr:hypothetical protein [Pseudomonas aeruginosa]PBN23840.1 hypothetical protein B8B65_28910 [Pseudomonas aeruginosa]